MSQTQPYPSDPSDQQDPSSLADEPERVDDPQVGADEERPIVDPAGEQVLPEELTDDAPDPADRTGVHDRAGDITEQG